MKKTLFASALVFFALAALGAAAPSQVPPQPGNLQKPIEGLCPADQELKARLLELGPKAPTGEAALMPEATGGPDGFGNTYIDSNQAGGPVYSWVEISGTGTFIAGWTDWDDGYAGPFNIGFSFPFYDASWTQFYAGTNGYLTFGYGTDNIGVSCPYPSSTINNFIMMMSGDLYVGEGFYQYFSSCPVGSGPCAVIEYQSWDFCCVHYSDNTMETILYPNGNILLQYAYNDGYGGSGLGISGDNVGANYGLSYTCGAPSTGLAVLFTYGGAVSPYDLAFKDDYGRSQVCVNSSTGDWQWSVLKGTGAGNVYSGLGRVTTGTGFMRVIVAPGSEYGMGLVYYPTTHRATATFTCWRDSVNSPLFDFNTLDDETSCGVLPTLPTDRTPLH